MDKDKATICIVNYKTVELTRLCLRSIRKFTNYPHEVLVIDNNSQDESSDYLKSLKWIRLIKRQPEPGEPGGGYAHGAGLDLGLENCNTEFFISLHSDVAIRQNNWLTRLVSYFNDDQQVACVGSGKIELTPKWRVLLKKGTDLRTFKRKLLKEPDPSGKYRYYNRTICSLYRTEILRKENLTFLMGRDDGLTAGKKLYFELFDRGYKTKELPASLLSRYLFHLAHATQAANRSEFNLRKRTIKKYNQLLDKIMSSDVIKDILSDASLDE